MNSLARKVILKLERDTGCLGSALRKIRGGGIMAGNLGDFSRERREKEKAAAAAKWRMREEIERDLLNRQREQFKARVANFKVGFPCALCLKTTSGPVIDVSMWAWEEHNDPDLYWVT
ncbi:hypothetical protein [Streptomyces sp. A1547]|uniref:hypothetical protein n=1 Tax=Streptomyces sp. A1547 TaxID=2563105 RepID=UPI00109EE29D|nr:hypothetical protein [Streptomyces sp. A1547]THA23362.1 hypothetical protein E6W17_41665 [Streptomyces sp. A1547]